VSNPLTLGGPVREVPWPRVRELVTDALAAAHKAHLAHAFAEVDVSRAVTAIETYKAASPEGLSFTGFLVYCLGRAVAEHPVLHAYRKGRKKLVMAGDVDVSTMIEKRKPDGALVPVSYVVRGANRKSLAEINDELRQAVRSDLAGDPGVSYRRRIMRLPRPARRLLWWWVTRDPDRFRRQWGTVMLSNVGSCMLPRPFFGMADSFFTCTLTIGGRYERVTWVGGRAEPRQTLNVTLTVDHDIVDGAPAARFGQTLTQLIEEAAGLEDCLAEQAARQAGTRVATDAREVRHAAV
jgi:pyruvate/2-oxoglutarate dehydrogenase complex dihydrolipoamide acyltransferase (E2) component